MIPPRLSLALFATTLFLGAALLFCVEPMVAKGLLPLLGGSPSVWTTCVAFFQATLLAGYLYAHLTLARLGVRRQSVLHVGLLALVALGLLAGSPVAVASPPTGSDPTAWLIVALAEAVGLPFFALATVAPLLQRWFVATGHDEADDPYFLYAASNLGSLLALLAYPLLVEPNLPIARQRRLWADGFLPLLVLTALCALAARRSHRPDPGRSGTADDGASPLPPSRRDRMLWVFLASVPSSLMLGVTTYLTTDIASVPLLWVIPLALYLLSFVVAFSRRPILPHDRVVRLLPIAVMAIAPALVAGLVQWFWMPLHLLAFFTAAMACHGELARCRPGRDHLTAFYLAISLGGVVGGLFNALVAPRLFDRVAEYPLAVFLSCLALPRAGSIRSIRRDLAIPAVLGLSTALLLADPGGLSETPAGMLGVVFASGLFCLVCLTYRSRPLRFALGIGAVLLAGGFSPGVEGRPLDRERTFFGVARVTRDAEGRFHRLFHGSTLHGQQSLDPSRRREPLTFFGRGGPIGQVFEALDSRTPRARVAIVGLGAGTLASYARPDQSWTFFEIDPAIVRIARDTRFFTYLHDSRAASLSVVVGDARLRIREAPDRGFDLIVLDAFSSDAVPPHLISREALALYRRKLSPGGRIVLNISNRYLDLEPLVGLQALDAGLRCRVRYDVDLGPEAKKAGFQPSIWAVMAARESDLGPIAADPRWATARVRPGDTPWTDDFSDLVGHLSLFRPPRPPSP